MPNTARWALPYPASSAAPNVPADLQALATALDSVAMDDQGLFSARPVSTVGTPGKKGRYWWATDTKILYRDNGTGWDIVSAITRDRVKVHPSVALPIPQVSSFTYLQFDTEDWDTNAMHDVVSNKSRLVAKTAGLYTISAQYSAVDPSENGIWGVAILKNAATIIAASHSTSFKGVNASIEDLAVIGDYYEMGVLQSHTPTGGTLNTAPPTSFSMSYITA